MRGREGFTVEAATNGFVTGALEEVITVEKSPGAAGFITGDVTGR